MSKEIKAWMVKDESGDCVAVATTEEQAWNDADELTFMSKEAMEEDGFSCVRVTIKEDK